MKFLYANTTDNRVIFLMNSVNKNGRFNFNEYQLSESCCATCCHSCEFNLSFDML